MFYDAIKNVYPNMNIISSIWVGYFATAPPLGVIQDLHDSLSVDDMIRKFNSYDNSNGSWPVLVGEYAAIYDTEYVDPINWTIQPYNPQLQRQSTSSVWKETRISLWESRTAP
jgi:alpha-N-arabinofuranosidase